jgi:predicted acetyltransferase
MLWNSLRLVEPSLPDFVEPIQEFKKRNKWISAQKKIDYTLKGLYCLCVDDKIVSVVYLNKNKIDRVITLPKYRHKGYASHLIKHITNQLIKAGVSPFSPVEPEIESLFIKLGWVKYDESCPDGTYDYFPAECEKEYRDARKEGKDYEIEITFLLQHLFSIMHPPYRL